MSLRRSERIANQQPKQPKQSTQPKSKKQQVANNEAMPAIIVNEDYSSQANLDEENEYWKKYFHTPNDHITKKYFEIVDYLENISTREIITNIAHDNKLDNVDEKPFLNQVNVEYIDGKLKISGLFEEAEKKIQEEKENRKMLIV